MDKDPKRDIIKNVITIVSSAIIVGACVLLYIAAGDDKHAAAVTPAAVYASPSPVQTEAVLLPPDPEALMELSGVTGYTEAAKSAHEVSYERGYAVLELTLSSGCVDGLTLRAPKLEEQLPPIEQELHKQDGDIFEDAYLLIPYLDPTGGVNLTDLSYFLDMASESMKQYKSFSMELDTVMLRAYVLDGCMVISAASR